MSKLNLEGNGQLDVNILRTMSENFPNLVQLNLNNTEVSHIGVRFLSENEWPKLKKISLSQNLLI